MLNDKEIEVLKKIENEIRKATGRDVEIPIWDIETIKQYAKSDDENKVKIISEKMNLDSETKIIFQSVFKSLMGNQDTKSDLEYEINPEQWAKLIGVFLCLKSIQSKYDYIESIKMKPSDKRVSIRANFVCLDLRNENLNRFRQAVQYADMFSVEANTDGELEIEIQVPNVYREK